MFSEKVFYRYGFFLVTWMMGRFLEIFEIFIVHISLRDKPLYIPFIYLIYTNKVQIISTR